MKYLCFFSISLLTLLSCKKDKASETPIKSVPTPVPITQCDTISFKKDIEPLISTYCLSCHNTQFTSASVDLSTFENVFINAESSLSSIQNGTMPPSGKLPENLIQKFNCWIKQGKLNN